MSILENFRSRLALRPGTDTEGTVSRVSSDATLSPENLWLLGCSAVIASIGLDVSSAAVIIGAMLISPLMGPILGVGLGLGITDRALLQRSLRELLIATGFALLASTAYFLVSPLATPTAEMIARTRPTLLDVAVALFGGVAGIVAGSRKKQSLALPGVAIATALMPQLCTSGFGLATGNWTFFLGAFYLFGLNAVFIALATFVVVRWLRFPHHEEATREERHRERALVTIVAIVAILPSVYFLYDAVREVRDQRRIASFVEHEIEAPGRAASQWEHHRDAGDTLKVYVAGRPVDPERAESLQVSLARYGLDGTTLQLIQSDISAEDLQRFQGQIQRDILRAVSSGTAARDSAALRRQRQDSTRMVTIAKELAGTFPEVRELSYTGRVDLLASDSLRSPPGVFVTFAPGIRLAGRREILARAQAFLRVRLSLPALVALER